MKQNITKKQFNETTEEGKEKLREWNDKLRGLYDIHLLSIGQMIEFLGENNFGKTWTISFISESYSMEKLCDDLWEAVKEVLNGK